MVHNDNNRNEGKIGPSRSQKIWMAIGAVVLVLILLFWIFDIGTFIGPNQ